MKDYVHKEYPKTCAADDFWGQVKRTVHGKPVPQEQIDMIFVAVKKGLDLGTGDVLLDLGCGNGALSSYFFEHCHEFLGVDFSEYLIDVAKVNFENPPLISFVLGDATEFVETYPQASRFTKALCYGVFSYFSLEQAVRVLSALATRFTRLERLFIGNLPDREHAHLFYPEGKNFSPLLDDRESPLGIWHNRDQIARLAERSGWRVEFRTMPKRFYAAHYRFDAIFSR